MNDDHQHGVGCPLSSESGEATSLCSIVVTYNSESVILSCLESLQASTISSRIIVVDNGSNDATLELVAENFPYIEVHTGSNLGFAGGCNRGLRLAGRDFSAYFFLNPDARVSPTCLDRLKKSLDEDSTFAIVSPTILEPTSGLVLYAGANFDLQTLNFELITSPDIADNSSTIETGRPAGAAMLVRKTSLEAVGPMNDSYFLYWEECEWAARFRSAGWKIGHVPNAKVLHSVSHSTGGIGTRVYEYYFTRNVLRLVSEFRHMSRSESVIRVLPLILHRLRVIASRRQVMRLLDAVRFDALGALDFLRGREGHRVGLPPISKLGHQAE
jgi:GT2 family glycosyltransferase